MSKLGKMLPKAHISQTAIRCIVTNEVMDEHNQPFYLPSGRLISKNAIQILQQQYRACDGIANEEGSFKCPISGKTVRESELRKVFFS
jgi:macrophage erythroblast attacher